MKSCIVLALCVLTVLVNAVPIEEQSERINGENGWYVPQVNGELKWLSTTEAQAQLAAYEALDKLENNQRRSSNAVNCYLYTQSNQNEGQAIEATKESIDASNFNPKNPTKITIHGWNSNYKEVVNSGLRLAWFLYGDYNMISVDWSRGRSLDYISSVAGVPPSALKVANLVDFLVKEYGMSLETLEIIGFSLGAHMAGHTAKQVQTGLVHKIVGLDPAMPLISYKNPEKRLCSTDAVYVETIQTSGGTMGYTQPIGKATFYPNGGKQQPGCDDDPIGLCSHGRVMSYYVEALILDNFPTMKCSSYVEANRHDCGSTYSPTVRLGSTKNEHVASGEYYVPVNSEYPFGVGETNENGEDDTTATWLTDTTEITSDTTTLSPEEDTTTTTPEDD